ncbi:hypothetical protein PMZ80_000162 [Knufia obscura]|uniref:Asl1-like glycosyl hydrolase catalytic domain-containing protein n=1 Tax=Knufia obscura TaxID=1635080 RepID=A0ABR0S0N5_9EURO|nr:hypothetical protein PMZ80_000162 [Knufia obscura]
MRPFTQLIATSLLSSLTTTASSQDTSNPKRGIAYLGTEHPNDYNIFLSRQSPITWYYNWSPYPVGRPSSFRDIEFVPLLHNLNSLSSDLRQLGNLPSSSTHLLTFNEPDHDTSGGGTNISPEDAASAYINQIAPLSVSNGGRWLISHPSTTGTLSGLNWLQRFNTSCYALNETHGCHADFLATHFYGDFPALASWLGTLDEYYNGNASSDAQLPIWITELALPQQSATANEVMMNTTLPYLDGLEYVERYSWFGIFREENANGWTGGGVALLDDGGDLSGLGAMYLGGGFEEGMSADDGGAEGAAVSTSRGSSLAVVIGVGLLSLFVGGLV